MNEGLDANSTAEAARGVELSVAVERDIYLERNGFSLAGYDQPWTPASLLGLRFSVPNTPKHRWALRLHDLHHLVTGYDTDLVGEGEISAWELRRGIRRLGLYTGSIVFSLVLVGLLIAPRRTLRAWKASLGGESLFADRWTYEQLLGLTVVQLRRALGVPEVGLGTLSQESQALGET